jgi:hypothetical protein
MSRPNDIHPTSSDARRLLLEAARRADAMGVMELDDTAPLDARTARRLVAHARRAGVAKTPAFALSNVETPTEQELTDLLRLVINALEGSPVPKTEWPSLSKVFGDEPLAHLLGISLSSLRRYQAGARDTPDAVADRLHFLALVVADLAGTYNDIGIRRWFDRPRSALGGKAPSALLRGDWDPEGPAARKVRQLARSLVSLSAS